MTGIKCRNCINYRNSWCKKVTDSPDPDIVRNCPHFKEATNADRIRSMSDEELAEWIHNGISSDHCDYCEYNNGYCDGAPCHGKADAEIIAEWLQQPAEGV